MMTQLHTLFDELARRLSMTLPTPLRFPLLLTLGDLTLTIEHEENRGTLVIHRSLGVVPLAREMELYRALLDANLFWGGTGDATIGVNAETREAMIAYRFDFRRMQADGLIALVEQFAVVTEVWRRFIEQPGNERPSFAMR